MAGDLAMSVSTRELEELSRRLKAQGGARQQRRYQRAVVGAVRPIVPQLRAAALGARVRASRGGTAAPVGGSRSRRPKGPLRPRIAAAIQVRPTSRGARIVVDAGRVDPEYGGSLPKYLDATLPGHARWRHPVMGNEDKWTNQYGSPWFFSTIERNAARVERAVLQAMGHVADEITR